MAAHRVFISWSRDKKIWWDGVEPARILPPTARGRIGSECPVHSPKAQKT